MSELNVTAGPVGLKAEASASVRLDVAFGNFFNKHPSPFEDQKVLRAMGTWVNDLNKRSFSQLEKTPILLTMLKLYGQELEQLGEDEYESAGLTDDSWELLRRAGYVE